MVLYATILGSIWIVFIAVWVVSALSAKRTVRRSWMGIGWRLAFVAVAIVLLHYHLIHGGVYLDGQVPWPVLNVVGLVLAALGVALAVWARLYLGRNWGMPMSVKENPELVTTGPYAHLRHPIYSGMLLAMLGSALVIWWWAVIMVWAFVYFIFAARGEERLMQSQFPDAYPAYKARTKMLVPFVF